MSFVTNQAFMHLNALNRMNSQFGLQQANQNLTDMTANSRQCGPLRSLKREQQLMFGSLQDQFMGKCAEVNEKSLKELQKKDIQRSFSTFA